VRFVITSDDVIHSWWVPALGWKQDAIPGFINEAWTSIEQPGIYRGQCAELCGKDHGFMPIVVEAVSKEDFNSGWRSASRRRPPRRHACGTCRTAAPAGEAPAAPAAAEAAAHLPPRPAARDVKPAAARGRGDNRF
jgi:cytochrome c oxidase subunit 2